MKSTNQSTVSRQSGPMRVVHSGLSPNWNSNFMGLQIISVTLTDRLAHFRTEVLNGNNYYSREEEEDFPFQLFALSDSGTEDLGKFKTSLSRQKYF